MPCLARRWRLQAVNATHAARTADQEPTLLPTLPLRMGHSFPASLERGGRQPYCPVLESVLS